MQQQLQNAVFDTLDWFMPRMLQAREDEPSPEQWQPEAADAYCPRCGASAGPGSVLPRGCPFCRGKRFPWQRVTRLGSYREPLAEWIKAMKFARHWPWGPWLGHQLSEQVGEPFDPARVAVCPVPMHWTRRCQRGFNQAHLMAQALARARGWPFAPILKRSRYTTPQTAIAPSQRPANIRGSFDIEWVDLTGWQLVLVDDIKTSGATLSTCARLLQQQGARSIDIAVAAVADPSGRDFKTV